MTPEGKVKKECRAYLKSIGAYVFSPVQMGYGAATVDDLCCVNGWFVGVEYKRADKPSTLTQRQKQTLTAIDKAKGIAVVARSVDDLRAAIDDAGLLIYP